MNSGMIIILSGPSGSGKTTLYKRLLKERALKGRLVKSISATTRAPRRGEKSGRDYIFLSRGEFLRRIKNNRLLEWQKVFDNYYGTPKHNVEQLLKKGKDVLLCIDVKGARVVRRMHPETVGIFINVPSLAVLKKRLKGRGSESPADLLKRLKTARQEMKEAKRYHCVIVNRDLEKAYRQLRSIIANIVFRCAPGCCCGKR